MESYFGNAYKGDPRVPHADSERFGNVWIGSTAFSVITFFKPYILQIYSQFNWHDRAFLHEQYHWKKAMEKNQLTNSSGINNPGRSATPTTTTGHSTGLESYPL